MPCPTVLVVDCSASRTSELHLILSYLECTPVCADSTNWRRHFDADNKPDVVLLGPTDEQAELKAVFSDVKSVDQHCPIIAMSKEASGINLDSEIEASCVAKVGLPLRHSELQNALQRAQTYTEGRRAGSGSRSIELFRNLVGTSRAVKDVRQLIEQVAGTDASVLISGESGTGKEVVARNIHYQSKRRYKPFVPVNCGAIHPELLESELFGHEKGAFTGAINTRRGRFEMADGGTLFLDEIGDMPLEMQVKLLRVIQ